MNTEELLSKWINTYQGSPGNYNIISIRRAEPRFLTRNYFARYKISVANLDGSGQNPSDLECFILEISETDQTALLVTGMLCDSIKDL